MSNATDRLDENSFFVHVTDLHLHRQTGIGWDALARFADQVRAMDPPPAFVVATGDIISASMSLTTQPDEVRDDFHRYSRVMRTLGVPVYHAVGNHDMTRTDRTPGTAEYGKALFETCGGPRYQSFDWQDRHAVVLDQWIVQPGEPGDDAETGDHAEPQRLVLTHDMDQDQLAWLRADLGRCPAGQTVLVFAHHRLMDDPRLWAKLDAVLPSHLQYTEVVGCDHQNSFWSDGRWRSFVTASFCGAWWDGPCIDLSDPGYALMVADPAVGLRPYYRPTQGELAVASPKPGQVVHDRFGIDAVDPTNGRRVVEKRNTTDLHPGWNRVRVRVGDRTQHVEVFREPPDRGPSVASHHVAIELELVDPSAKPLVVRCNEAPVGRLTGPHAAREMFTFEVDRGLLRQWTCVTLDGEAVVRSPRLVVDGRPVPCVRTERLEQLRPDWFGSDGIKRLAWDTTGKRPMTPARRPGNRFFYWCTRP